MRAASLGLGAVVLVALATACGHGAGTTRAPEGRAPGEVTLTERGGRRLAVLPFETHGLVHASLWIDAGSRDASPPQIAFLAAELAAAAAGPEVEAWVSPDGIELTLEGEVGELPELLEQLGAALAFRDVQSAGLGRALRDLAAGRQRAQTDRGRTASELSVRALLGRGADGLFPLGVAEDDPSVQAPAVRRFLADHFGADRALLVLSGSIDDAAARAAWERANRSWPRAGVPRAERPALSGRQAVQVGVDSQRAWAATALFANIEAGLAARDIVLEAYRGRTSAPPEAWAYPLRGGALLTVVLAESPGPEGERRLAHAMLRAIDAAVPGDGAPWAGSPRDAARQVGLWWSAKPGAGAASPALGVGAVVDGGRGDRPSDADPDAAVRRAALAELEAGLRWAREAARPTLRLLPDRWRALPNGARLRLQLGPDASPLGLAVAFDGGLGEEPPSVQGRTLLVAEALARACAREVGEAAVVKGWAEDRAFGVWAEAPADRFTEVSERLLRCALSSPLDARAVEDARVELLERLAREPAADVLAATSAALSPRAPALVWPLGSSASLQRVRLPGVAEVLTRARVGRRTRVSIVGPVAEERAVRFVASVLSSLPVGTSAAPSVPGAAERGPVPLMATETPFVVASVRLPPGSPTEGRAYADAYAAALRARGVRVGWWGGGGGAWGRWAAVRIDGSPEDLPRLAEHARVTRPDPRVYALQLRERARARRWGAATPGPLAAMAIAGGSPPTDAGAALPTPEPPGPVLLIGRDQPAEAYQRLREAP